MKVSNQVLGGKGCVVSAGHRMQCLYSRYFTDSGECRMQRMSNCNRGTAPDKARKKEVNKNSDPDPSFFLGGEVRLGPRG